ncbi:MAG TPA: Flp family type IVb pilin [Candidatus Polarisedimenticolia bacterium]|jgi:Flp pilus assembly pilin Flp|nr:Flp family type IVb pilin [Candidatus Polarisedimenticolia bacterium]
MIERLVQRLFPSDLLSRQDGQDLAEYGMLAALIAVVVIATLVTVGNSLAILWNNITAAFAALP